MTTDDVRAAAEQLVEFHDRFALLFGKAQAQDHAYTYLKGLLCCPERKSIEPIALCVGDGQVSGLQKFIGVAPWAYDDVQAEAQPSSQGDSRPRPTPAPSVSSAWSTSRPSPRRGPRAPAWRASTTAGSARKTTAKWVSS